MYEIRIDWHNHVSGYGSEIYVEKFIDINTAKRKLLDLTFKNENLFEENAKCEISKNFMKSYLSGGRDNCSYTIIETSLKICEEKSSEISKEELKEIIEENSNAGRIKIEIFE